MHQNTSAPLLWAALAAVERGWRVFPLLPGRKRPAITGWERRATADVRQIERCWTAVPYNVGIATGPSRLVVVDLDVPKHAQDLAPTGTPAGVGDGRDELARLAERYGRPYPGETYAVRTGSGGTHLYFGAAVGVELRNTSGALGWKIDTRAGGGYVVGAGSNVGGSPYLAVRAEAPAPLPAWIARLLIPAPLPPQTAVVASVAATDRLSAYLRSAVQGERGRVTAARTGSRNNALYVAAVALGQLVAGGELSAQQVRNWLIADALSVGLAEAEARRTVESGLRAGAKRPRSIARRTAA